MKMETRILDNRLYYTRKIESHRKSKKSRTVSDNTDIDLSFWQRNISVLIKVRRVHYGETGEAPITVWRPILEKENFEFKPVNLCNNLTLYSILNVRRGWVHIYMYWIAIFFL